MAKHSKQVATVQGAQPAPVAVRNGTSLQTVTYGPKPYRVQAGKNVAWWAQLTAGLQANNPLTLAPILETQANPSGVPNHFVYYCLRNGYLAVPVTA
jgi:hypothetical protein